ncbi:MAG: efflux RND transporter periplasmic adaptor subunit [Bacteroidales bacterium]|nr:efflux RND transporter periplasmic adaptor subunit [Bacteroidales bacterium]MBQ6101950.1 efflux RND transporter periplasmic adaptor subunit [Bacteroidales bacterium]
MKKKKVKWFIILGIVALIAIICIVKATKSSKKELVIRTHVVSEYTVENTVTATGTIEPVETVDVGTQVSGKVEKIYVDFNDVVKKGQLMAELDKLTLNQNVSRAKASLTSAESQLNYAKLSYERTKQLYESNAATLASYQEAQNTYTQAQMSQKNAQAAYDQALVDLSYAEIYSPIDGVVLDRAVEVGQTVAASFSTPTLFTLANDLTKMQVEAAVDEADIGQVKIGQRVTFTVDAYTYETFEGTVNQIRMKATTTSNVVKYTVIISAPNPDLKLFPGMTANVTIITEEATGLAVPAEALNFTPDEQVLRNLQKPEMPKDGQRPPMGEAPQMGTEPSAHNMVWIQKNGSIMPRPVKVGMSDVAYKIIEEGLQEGDSVVLSAQYVVKEKQVKKGENPFMPGPPGRNKKK